MCDPFENLNARVYNRMKREASTSTDGISSPFHQSSRNQRDEERERERERERNRERERERDSGVPLC
jgi:hypothetical protein